MKATTKSEELVHKIESHINHLLDEFHDATRVFNGNLVANFLSDDCLYLGTDPSDVYNKENIAKAMNEYAMVMDKLHYEVDSRVIKVSEDGNFVVSIEEFIEPSVSRVMQLRVELHWMQIKNKWKIFVGNWAFIAEDKDLPTIDRALLGSMQHHN